ncbi:flagellin, partial [Neopusillimonas maritima]
TYTKDTNNDAATSDNLFAALADGDTVTYTGTDTGLGLSASGGTYTYDSASDSFSFNVDHALDPDVATYITPATGETTEATVTIGGSSQDILIDSNGNITAADDGAQLYLDATGNLTKNNAGTDPAATASGLAAAMANDNGDKIEIGDAAYVSDGVDFMVSNVSISREGLKNLADAANGATAYSVTLSGTEYGVQVGGTVTDDMGAVPQYIDANGALTTNAITTTTYFAQESGVVTDDAGAQVYVDGDGEFTLDSTTTGARTDNPLDVLDAALAQVDALRSDLGAIQNRFESAITNLQTTSNNLSAAQSRIQDADYSVEVANMTRAQILQQAGTSVLAQANQIPQGVLSLLR